LKNNRTQTSALASPSGNQFSAAIMAVESNNRGDIPVDMHMTTGPDDWKLRAGHDERFYANGTPRVPDLAMEVLTQYSKIPEAEVQDHVMAMVRSLPGLLSPTHHLYSATAPTTSTRTRASAASAS
jgi:hypothetical protein